MKPFNGALFTLLLASIAFAACKKKTESTTDPNGLPKASQTGAMIFACKIDGANWISNKKTFSIGGGTDNEIIAVHGSNDSGTSGYFEVLEIQVNNARTGVAYTLDGTTANFATYTTGKKCSSSQGTTRIKSTSGTVTFTRIDRTNRIISGTFSTQFSTDNCGDIKITEGRFDVRY